METCGLTIANPHHNSQEAVPASASATRLKRTRRKMKKALLITLFLLYPVGLATWAFAWIAPMTPVVSEPGIMVLVGACLITLKHLMAKTK